MNFVSNALSSAASLLKVALMSKSVGPKGDDKGRNPLVIMGNGPSLRQTIDESSGLLLACDLMAVNFFANTPDFLSLRPRYYVLADGVFFADTGNANVRRLWEELARVSWKMTLFVPAKYEQFAKAFLLNNGCITLRRFNLTPVEGFEGFSRLLFDSGLGMPRPRNVMIPSIMCGIREGYNRIYLCGADHTWTRTLSVDDDNFVVSIQPHFYKDNEKEHERVREAYRGLHLHDVLGSMTVAFRSYWAIAAYARRRGVEILNATPASMIDAFPRAPLPGK